MKKTINTMQGLTLIELLVAAAIIGVLSVISTQLLFDTISVRSKQNSIETSSDAAYLIIEQIVSSVKEAKSIEVKPGGAQIEIMGDTYCLSYRYNSTDKTIEKAKDVVATCTPSSYSVITPSNLTVNNVIFSPEGTSPENVSISVEGEVKDSFSTHPFEYQTTIFPRVN